MEELKMQNGLLLQLINSKNRQNQILFQQYEQLAQDNQKLQAQIHQLKNQQAELKRNISTPHHQVASRHSPFDLEIADLKKKCSQYVVVIADLKTQLEEKGGAIIFLESQLQNAKGSVKPSPEEEQLRETLKEVSEKLDSKQRSLSELTEYMNEQAEKISDLTRAGIIAIENYEGKLEEKDKLTEELNQRITELTLKLQSCPQQSEVQVNDEGGEKVKELQTIILSKQQSINQLSQFLQQQSQKVSKLEADLSQSNLEALQNEINSLKSIIQGKEQSIIDLSEFLDMLSQKNKEMEEKIQQMESNPSPSQAKQETDNVEQLKEDLLKSQQENQRLANEISESTSYLQEIDILRARMSTKQDELAQREREMVMIQQQKFNLTQTIERLQAEKEFLIKQQKQNNDNYESVLAENRHLMERIGHLQKNNGENSHHASQQQNTALQSAINDLQETITSKSQTIAQLSQYMNEQSLKIEQLESQIASAPCLSNDKAQQLQQILKSKETALAELTQYLQDTLNKNMELTSLLENAQNQQSQHQVEEESNLALKSRQERLDQLQELVASKEKDLAEAAQKLQQTAQLVKGEQQKLESYAALIQETLGNLSSLTEQITILTQQYAKLKSQSETAKNQCQSNEELLQSLRKQVQVERAQKHRVSEKQKQEVLLSEQCDKGEELARLQAKITQYEGYLNDKEEQMAAMMEVMESLQLEIQNKNEEIEQLQLRQNNSQPENSERIREMQVEMDRPRQNLSDLQRQVGRQPEEIAELQHQYDQVEMQSQMLQRSELLAKAYQQQLREMEHDVEGVMSLEVAACEEQVENNEQLTVLQVIEQILVYSQEQSDLSSVMRMIEVLKRSYLRQNESILKENSELKDSLSRILEINNTIVEERERFMAEIEELKGKIQDGRQANKELQDKMRILESNYHQEIKQLRKSISGLKDESPIIAKELNHEDLVTISRLQDEILSLKQQNHKKQAELEHLRAHSNKKFVKELNNLLDSCTVNKEDEKDWKEMEQELEKAAAEKEEMLLKCKEYEEEIANLEKRCLQLTRLAEDLNRNIAEQARQIEKGQQQAIHEAQQQKLLVGLEGALKTGQEKQSLEMLQLNEDSFQRLRVENEQLQGLIGDKNFAINELEETLLSLEKGYNSEIMGLRKNIAELQSESIALRKSLYQANPNGVDIGELIKDTFSQSDKDTEFFRPTFPLYTQHLFEAQPLQPNHSYYSEIHRVRSNPKSHYQRYFPAELSMGEKFMGRRCRQGALGAYREEARAQRY